MTRTPPQCGAECAHWPGHPCDREPGHPGAHRAYWDVIDEPVFWAADDAGTTPALRSRVIAGANGDGGHSQS